MSDLQTAVAHTLALTNGCGCIMCTKGCVPYADVVLQMPEMESMRVAWWTIAMSIATAANDGADLDKVRSEAEFWLVERGLDVAIVAWVMSWVAS